MIIMTIIINTFTLSLMHFLRHLVMTSSSSALSQPHSLQTKASFVFISDSEPDVTNWRRLKTNKTVVIRKVLFVVNVKMCFLKFKLKSKDVCLLHYFIKNSLKSSLFDTFFFIFTHFFLSFPPGEHVLSLENIFT